MDLATIIGIALALAAILGGQLLEGGHIGSIAQPTAAIIVLGGTLGAAMVQFPLKVVIASWKGVVKAFLEPKSNNKEVIAEIVRLATKARKEGIISLESETANATDPFLRKSLVMAVDGIEPKVLRETTVLKSSNMEEENEDLVKYFEALGGYAPTIGIIGAVLGLIHVMENLADPSKLGGGIAVAFVATVYGVGSANVLFLPLANKLKALVARQVKYKEMVVDGLEAIGNGENPRNIEMRLEGYIA